MLHGQRLYKRKPFLVLIVYSEMAFFFHFRSLAEDVLVLSHAIQEKFIAQLENSTVNFTLKTDIAPIAS